MHFVRLTDRSVGDVTVNMYHVATFRPHLGGAEVVLVDGRILTVTETPAQITEMLLGPR